MRKFLTAFALMTISGLFQTITAQKLDFKIINETGITLFAIYVGESSDEEWGEDLLPKDVLADGESVDITFTRGKVNTCEWDLLVTKDKEGKKYTTVMGINLCEVSVITLRMKNGKIVYWKE